jgi:hypothetical protein
MMSDNPLPTEADFVAQQHEGLAGAIDRLRANLPNAADPKSPYFNRPDLVARDTAIYEQKIAEISARAGYATPPPETPEQRADRHLAEAYDPGTLDDGISGLIQGEIDRLEAASDGERATALSKIVTDLGQDAAMTRYLSDRSAPHPSQMDWRAIEGLGRVAYDQLVEQAKAGSTETLPKGALHSIHALRVLAVAGRANAGHQRALAARGRR